MQEWNNSEQIYLKKSENLHKDYFIFGKKSVPEKKVNIIKNNNPNFSA